MQRVVRFSLAGLLAFAVLASRLAATRSRFLRQHRRQYHSHGYGFAAGTSVAVGGTTQLAASVDAGAA